MRPFDRKNSSKNALIPSEQKPLLVRRSDIVTSERFKGPVSGANQLRAKNANTNSQLKAKSASTNSSTSSTSANTSPNPPSRSSSTSSTSSSNSPLPPPPPPTTTTPTTTTTTTTTTKLPLFSFRVTITHGVILSSKRMFLDKIKILNLQTSFTIQAESQCKITISSIQKLCLQGT